MQESDTERGNDRIVAAISPALTSLLGNGRAQIWSSAQACLARSPDGPANTPASSQKRRKSPR